MKIAWKEQWNRRPTNHEKETREKAQTREGKRRYIDLKASPVQWERERERERERESPSSSVCFLYVSKSRTIVFDVDTHLLRVRIFTVNKSKKIYPERTISTSIITLSSNWNMESFFVLIWKHHNVQVWDFVLVRLERWFYLFGFWIKQKQNKREREKSVRSDLLSGEACFSLFVFMFLWFCLNVLDKVLFRERLKFTSFCLK